MGVHVFTGPTAAGDTAREMVPGCSIHPPAQHGDFIRNEFAAGDIVVLIDGLYHGNPPIRHKEILDAIARGVSMIGASSMGALRAAELHQFGMMGVGRIFEDYRDGRIEADDEVAVLHTEGPEWKVLSEALVNMRYTLELARQAMVVSPFEEEQLLEAARSLHYPRRSWRAVERACENDQSLREAARRVLQFDEEAGCAGNLKYQDACAGLRYAQALSESAVPVKAPSQQVSWPKGWRTTYLGKWQHDFTGTSVYDRFVSKASQFDYQRLFGYDQVQRWRRYVLSVMADLPPDVPLDDLEEQALTAAAAAHLGADSIPDGRAEHWLTESEKQELSSPQQLLAVLVRSSRLTANLRDERSARWLLPQEEHIFELISSSLHINEQVVLTSFSKHIDHLKQSVLERHLRVLWDLETNAGSPELDAAARDRGFASGSEAAEALRPFFLKDHNDRLRNGA